MTALTDASGNVIERYLYDPYGRRMVLDGDWSGDSDNTSDVGFVHGHQGLRYDAAVGLYDSRLRPYDPELGRFVSQDPLGYIDGANRYQGYGSRPGNYVDPAGLSFSDPIGGIAPPPGTEMGKHEDPIGGIAPAGAGEGETVLIDYEDEDENGKPVGRLPGPLGYPGDREVNRDIGNGRRRDAAEPVANAVEIGTQGLIGLGEGIEKEAKDPLNWLPTGSAAKGAVAGTAVVVAIIAKGLKNLPEIAKAAEVAVKHADEVAEAARRAKLSRGDRFEETVRDTFRNKVIRQNEGLYDRTGRQLGEIDFETDEALVEVGLSLKDKVVQLHRLAEEAARRGKRLDVIYGPETNPKRLEAIKEALRKRHGSRVRFIPGEEK